MSLICSPPYGGVGGSPKRKPRSHDQGTEIRRMIRKICLIIDYENASYSNFIVSKYLKIK